MTASATTFVPTGVCHDTADAAPAMTNALAAASATAARFTSSPFLVERFASTGKSYRWPVLGRRHAASTPVAARKGALPRVASARGHKTDTSETTRATSCDTSRAVRGGRFPAKSASRDRACRPENLHGKEGFNPQRLLSVLSALLANALANKQKSPCK